METTREYDRSLMNCETEFPTTMSLECVEILSPSALEQPGTVQLFAGLAGSLQCAEQM